MSPWFQALSAANQLAWFIATILFALAFWKLHRLAPSAASLTGMITCAIQLLLWLLVESIGILGYVSARAYEFYKIPHMFDVISFAFAGSHSAILLSMAWILHRRIGQSPPDHSPTTGQPSIHSSSDNRSFDFPRSSPS
jgi:hypothetical protein